MARISAERRLYEALLERHGRDVAEAFRRALAELRAGVEVQKVIAAIERGDIDAAVDAMNISPAAFEPVREALRQTYSAGGLSTVKAMPRSVSVGFRFDIGNPQAAAWVLENAGNLITGILDDQLGGIRQALSDGLLAGRNPRAIALDIVGRVNRATGLREGGVIGLSGPQREAVSRAISELASGDPAQLRNYLTRARRDRRFDRSVERAIRGGARLTQEQRANMIRAYEAGLLKLRGEAIGRTEALQSVHAAKHEAYRQLALAGRVAEADIRRTWRAVNDNRTRDAHEAMSGQEVGLNGLFQSPTGALMAYPGDASRGASASDLINCRCDVSVRIERRR